MDKDKNNSKKNSTQKRTNESKTVKIDPDKAEYKIRNVMYSDDDIRVGKD